MLKRSFLIPAVVFVCGVQAARIGVLPLENGSGYKGHWTLGREIQEYAGQCLAKTYHVVSADSISRFIKKNRKALGDLSAPAAQRRVARHFNADFLVSGIIREFTVRKQILGEGKYGGMKHYLARIRVKAKVYSLSANDVIGREELSVEKKENLTAVNLGKLSTDEARFDSLNTAGFGSPVFEKTVAGEMMRDFCDKLFGMIQKLPEPVARRGEDKKLVKTAKIVDLTSGDVYINAGFDDKVEIGDEFKVYTPGDSIRDPDTGEFLGVSEKYAGTLRITFVQASHFSRGKTVKQAEPLKLGDRVRIEK